MVLVIQQNLVILKDLEVLVNQLHLEVLLLKVLEDQLLLQDLDFLQVLVIHLVL
jgi:hypothetical protein